MDVISHGLWSYLIWRAAPLTGLAVALGMMPDVVAHAPRTVSNVVSGRKGYSGLTTHKDLPKTIQAYEKYAFPAMHSLILSSLFAGLMFIVFKTPWWALAWPVHVLIDIPTHPKRFATPFLWPVSDFKVSSFYWESKPFMAVNILALIIAYVHWVF